MIILDDPLPFQPLMKAAMQVMEFHGGSLMAPWSHETSIGMAVALQDEVTFKRTGEPGYFGVEGRQWLRVEGDQERLMVIFDHETDPPSLRVETTSRAFATIVLMFSEVIADEIVAA